MDREVSVRFYEIISAEGQPNLGDAIRRIGAIPDKTNRQRGLARGLDIRLEHLEERGNLLLGDLTRVQTENLPGQVTAVDVEELPFGELGHSIAFCYDTAVGALALQFHLQAQVKRVLQYFGEFAPNSSFVEFPLLDAASVASLTDKNIKRLSFRVSGIREFRDADANANDFERGLARMASLLDAPQVEVVLSTRPRSDDYLDENAVVGFLRRMLRRRANGDTTVKKLVAETAEDEDPFNFITQLLKTKETLDLPANDPVRARQVRIRFLHRTYGEHATNIHRMLADGTD